MSISENIPELPPEPPRESLIATAVKFLQNSKVNHSPLEQKRQFLTKKGLTDEEIEISISRSGIGTTPNAIPGAGPVVQQQMQPISTWSRIREYSAITIIIGGVVYGLYSLYKRFIEPFFFKRAEVQDEKLEQMEQGIKNVSDELGQNMQEIRSIMSGMQDQLGEQSMKIGQVAANLTSYKANSNNGNLSNSAIGELKAEITSVKGLLLSRNQFPAKPSAPPIIPSWQMKSRTTPPTQTNSEEDQLKNEHQELVTTDERESDDVTVHTENLFRNEVEENETDHLHTKKIEQVNGYGSHDMEGGGDGISPGQYNENGVRTG